MLEDISEFIQAVTDEVIALIVVVVILVTNAYQVTQGKTDLLGLEPLLLVLGYYFGKKMA